MYIVTRQRFRMRNDTLWCAKTVPQLILSNYSWGTHVCERKAEFVISSFDFDNTNRLCSDDTEPIGGIVVVVWRRRSANIGDGAWLRRRGSWDQHLITSLKISNYFNFSKEMCVTKLLLFESEKLWFGIGFRVCACPTSSVLIFAMFPPAKLIFEVVLTTTRGVEDSAGICWSVPSTLVSVKTFDVTKGRVGAEIFQ